MACLCVVLVTPFCLLIERPSLFLQLRVIRAFKSTLEDLEERRSVHSLHSLHSMRSSRSHTGTRPLSDITYIDDDPTNSVLKLASKSAHNAIADQDSEMNNARGTRIPSLNSPASPLFLHVPGTGPTYNHHPNNRTTTNNTIPTQPSSPNSHTVIQLNNNDDANPLRSSSNNLVLPELPKFVHETCI